MVKAVGTKIRTSNGTREVSQAGVGDGRELRTRILSGYLMAGGGQRVTIQCAETQEKEQWF